MSALAVLPSPAAAVEADLTAQFRRVKESVQLFRPDGSVVDTTLSSEFWSQTLALRHGRRFGASTMVTGEFDWTDNYYLGRTYRSQTPTARVNVADPRFGLMAVYEPTRSRVAATPIAGLQPPGTQEGRPSILNSQHTQLAAYLSLPQLPRLDVSWERSHRSAYLYSAQQTSIARSARLAHTLGPLSLHGGYSDVARGAGSAKVDAPYQSAWDAQGGIAVAPRRDVSLSTQYSFSTVQRRFQTTVPDRSTNHSASVGGNYHPRTDLSLDLSYALRHMTTRGRQRSSTDGQDGALSLSYRPISIATLNVAGTVRTDAAEEGNTTARAFVGSARVGGRARRGLDVDATASHSWTWDHSQSGVTFDAVAGHSRLAVRKSLELTCGVDVSSSGQPGLTRERSVLITSVGVMAHPLRTLSMNASQSGYAAGPRLGSVSSRSRSRSLDMSWRPSRSLAVQAGFGEAGSQPNNRPRTTSQRYDVRWQPSSILQLSTVYTRSGYTQTAAGTSPQASNESVASRLTTALGRSATLSTGYSLSDPGTHHQTRQYDASVTKSFGR